MGNLNLNLIVCGLLLSTLAVGQDVVTVTLGTCLPNLGFMSLTGTAGPGPSALPAGPGGMSNRPWVTCYIRWQMIHLI